MRKITSSIALILVLSFVLFSLLEIGTVKAEDIIYIRADGTVEPDNAPIKRDGNVYTFTGNIYDSIVVERDNVVVDGCGYTLQGTGTGNGIDLSERNNVTVKNFEINQFDTGVYIYDYSEPGNNTISGNKITNNIYGIHIDSSHSNTISGNTITNNDHAIFLLVSHFNGLRNNRMVDNEQNLIVQGGYLAALTQYTDTSNTVNGKPVYYWVEEQDKTVPSDAGYVALIRCTNITVQNLHLTNNGQGILLASTKDSTITKNTITNNGEGIYLWDSSNNIISENTLTNNNRGIHIRGAYPTYSLNNTIYGNHITNNWNGIFLVDTSNNVFRNNRMISNDRSFVDLTFYVNDVDVSNTVNGKPIYYWVNEHDKTIPSDAGYVALVNCVNITVQNLELANEDYGIMLGSTINSTIANNIITNNSHGVYLTKSPNNTVSGNYIINNNNGIWLYNSSNNNIVGNYIANNRNGTSIILSPFMPTSSNNLFYHNSYVNNSRQIYITPPGFAIPNSINVWDNAVEGNYWSDYVGVDNNGDGIGDSPYIIYENNRDNYPLTASLMSPIYIFDAGTWEWTQYNVYVVSNSIVSDFNFNPEEGALLRFDIEGEAGTTGFCRVTVPKDLLYAEGNWTVLVDGYSVTPTVNEDASNTYLYFTYNHSTKTIEIIGTTAIPEFPSWIILPLLITATLVIIIYKQKISKNTKTNRNRSY